MDFLQDWDERGCPGNMVFENIISITAPHLRKIVHAGGTARANIYLRMKKHYLKDFFYFELSYPSRCVFSLSRNTESTISTLATLLPIGTSANLPIWFRPSATMASANVLLKALEE